MLGESLRAICRDDHLPPESTVRGWYVDDIESFAAQYARARDIGLDAMADQAMEIADTQEEGVKTVDKWSGSEVHRADMLEHRRLRFDARRWYLSKLAPKRYGDRLHTELTGADGGPIQIADDESIAAKLVAILDAIKRRMEADGYDLV